MQFGIQFFPALSPADKSPRDYFAESLALVEEGEALGMTHARTVEHYFNRYGGYSPNPIVFLAAASQRTRTMRLVTGAVLPVFNHPFKLAGEIAMLDAISGGRLDVGFARAFLPHEFRRFGISPDESQARFHEGLEQVDLLLTREHATHKGKFHSFENVTSLPRPTQTPRPKFYMAATQTAEIVRVRGPARLCADDDPDRPDQGTDRAFTAGLASGRTSGRRRGDDRLPHVLPRGWCAGARDRA